MSLISCFSSSLAAATLAHGVPSGMSRASATSTVSTAARLSSACLPGLAARRSSLVRSLHHVSADSDGNPSAGRRSGNTERQTRVGWPERSPCLGTGCPVASPSSSSALNAQRAYAADSASSASSLGLTRATDTMRSMSSCVSVQSGVMGSGP